MSIKLFPKLEDVNLTEYADNSAYEPYTGIVLDPEDKVFKTVSGMFHDKKEFYEKMSDRGYIVRKVFEKKVFDWIEEHAKTVLDGYLMYSTAFSKWKGNNLLNPYYTQLLNDIPQLNREKRKGDPNSVGINQKKDEAVITEEHTYSYINPDWGKHQVEIIPLNNDGTIRSDIEPLVMKNIPFNGDVIRANDYLRSNPNFVYDLYSEIARGAYKLKAHPYFGEEDAPNKFLIRVDGRIVRHNTDEVKANGGLLSWDAKDEPLIVNRNSIVNWNDEANKGQKIDINPQALVQHKDKQINNEIDNYLVSHMADIAAEDDVVPLQQQSDEYRKAISNLSKNPLNLIKGAGGEERVNKKTRNILKRYENDIAILQDGKSNPDYENTLKTWSAEDRTEAVSKIKQAKKDLLNSVQLLNTDNSKIKDINQAIEDMEGLIANNEASPYKTVDDYLEINDRLRQKLRHLQSYLGYAKSQANQKKANKDQNEIKSWGELPTNYIKGYRAKFVNGNPNDLKSESCDCENTIKRISWKDGIPIVDEIAPGKHVNHGAMLGYLYQPIDGVITNPGAITMSGTFMTEQDEHWGWVHEQLNQDLFAGTHLKPEVREALLRIANKFKTDLGIAIEPVDIYFTGSGANFNYNDLSDIDLHLVYNFEEIGINAEILIKYFIAKKQVFNNDYEIRIKGMPVEVGVENLNEPIVSSAVYSVVNDKWLVQPEYAEQLLPRPDMKQYYEIVQKIEDAIETRDSKRIGEVWTELYNIRKESLKQDGEYGQGNALFKKLRNLGYLDRLKKAYYSSASEELSLEALEEII